jgi:hypothetical protein
MVVASNRRDHVMSKVSDTQLVILNAACQRDDRMVLPLPKHMGGEKPNPAAGNSIKSMLKNGLIEEVDAKLGEPVWRETGDGHGVTLAATNAVLEALGIEGGDGRKAKATKAAEPAKTAKKRRSAAKKPKKKQTKTGRVGKSKAEKRAPRAARSDSKQARLIAMLRRAKGASIDEIVEAFDWQPHTVRGAIAGALKKKLGLDVNSEKVEGRGRVYRIDA